MQKSLRAMFSAEKNKLSGKCNIKDMAEDQAQAMHMLGITKAYLLGISQGGMIAMQLAAEHPELILVNTAASGNETVQRVAGNWKQLAMAVN